MDLEEELQDLPIGKARWIEDDLDGLGMSVMVAIGRMGVAAARVAHPRGQNAVAVAQQLLHAPEATAGENCAFLIHWVSSTWFK